MNHYTLSPQGQNLQRQLVQLQQQITALEKQQGMAAKIHVGGAGVALSTAYEQLRNAAEYTEEHLLLQRAIRRFLTRNVSFYDKHLSNDIGEELIIELTQSGYLANDSIAKSYIGDIESLVNGYYNVYWQLRDKRIPQEKAARWTMDMMSVTTESIFHRTDALRAEMFASFAHEHYFEGMKKQYRGKQENYDTALYIAVHRTLLKSDKPSTRAALIARQHDNFTDEKSYANFNHGFDLLFDASPTDALTRLVSKNGAPLRILQRLINELPEVTEAFNSRASLLAVFESQTEKEYVMVEKKVNRGVLKSIAFLFITKVLVGLAIEIPYDLYFNGMIIVLPLAINLLFPPIFMASLRLSMKLPGRANTDALREYVDNMFYINHDVGHKIFAKPKTSGSSLLLNIIYGAMFIFVFSFVAFRLWLWGFSAVHIFIFFLFLSTASFLGFRLSRLISELEMVNTNQGIVAIVRDFAYTPFILVGRWISDNYSKVNIVALVLDMAIELPLKTFLRLTRQWTKFLNDKKDQL